MADNENMQLKISVFKGGFQNKKPDYIIDDFEDLGDLLTYVKEGAKNGDYFVRGFCNGDRSDANMEDISLIIIDGDSTINNGASCVPPQQVHEALKEANFSHIIYTSYSNDLMNNRNKWRLVIPCNDLVDKASLRQGVAEIIAGLHRRGLPVRNVKENNTMSQAWFTPRCPIGLEDDFWCGIHKGETYKLTGEVTEDHSTIIDKNRNDCGIFNWGTVFDGFASGTLHQGLVSATGWLILTTDWWDAQIKQHLVGLVEGLCPDKEKVIRATEGKEIDKIIKHCRSKAGLTVEVASDWREHHITAAELQHKEFPPVKWAVDGLIPEGLIILAGDPKVGKSLLAVDICSAIAGGCEAFGSQPCVKGSAVYVSLEDPQRRVKERIAQQVDLWPESFHLVTGGIGKVGVDFYKMLDSWKNIFVDLRCIVIDTMSYIIPEKKSGVADYDHYYAVLDPLHRWALDNNISVVCITHKRKGINSNGDNPFDGIIGSTAIAGCADALLMLSRNHAKAQDANNIDLADGFLEVTGREIASEKYALEFDTEAIRWALKGDIEPKDLTANTNWLLILDVLKKKKTKQGEISEISKLNKNTVKSALTKMKKQNLVESTKDGWCCFGVKYDDVVDDSGRWD